ncbi:TetR/AcrR family transcriptional regulator [Tsukamurella sp. 8F]|uniref:TetR/AcrR family transcriptional regulator n=1 Tax=unclassified Tsukamurella TaxID=2633480 RepID=UPI0023B8F21A|nr:MULTISPECIES: TetR/AcrR family transcriptional regulator [unclassified Tsukamurella]MDF0530215.1 TetR/AcrR family transcriptional regulator [Tsukamurella sp. 8J]MDF0586532.1 TetR/AcrR family transcriptional regulator [Tsukamurella sp. 8F]
MTLPFEQPSPAPRPRADAVRNREKILAAATSAFSAGEGDLTFEALARRAGVGIGTLYRNFADRQALVEAVYRAELDDVVEHADALLAEYPADVALRRWIDRYATFVTTKRGMAQAFQQAVASGAIAAPRTRERIRETVESFLAAGAESGVLRADVDGDDATTALLSAVLGTAGAGVSAEQRARVLDILVDGLRAR